jgi:hypothetical protein
MFTSAAVPQHGADLRKLRKRIMEEAAEEVSSEL